MIRATEADRPAITAFLIAHVATAMFPLSNLDRHGMSGGHPRAMKFWLRWQDGKVTDLIGMSEEGMIFPQCPTGPWGEVRVVLAGGLAKGVIGGAGQVAACRAALGLSAAAELDEVEPHYTLALADLIAPDAGGLTLHPLQAVPLEMLIDWRAAYAVESLSCPPEDAAERAMQDIRSYLDADSHRVLMNDGAPVAMTGFNAMLSRVVQVGGVYTPHALRARGYARLAVALHLAEARDRGVTDAVLSAANVAAARAYEAIGFAQCGEFAILAYDEPQVIHG